MDTRNRNRVLSSAVWAALALGALGLPTRLVAQGPPQPGDTLPPGVTAAMVAQGKTIFGGQGLCLACHGPDGKGTVGPNLTDKAWLHGSGSYAEIVERILQGVPMDQSKSGQMMPPKGGAAIDDAQVKAVAAYVWTLSRRGRGR